MVQWITMMQDIVLANSLLGHYNRPSNLPITRRFSKKPLTGYNFENPGYINFIYFYSLISMLTTLSIKVA